MSTFYFRCASTATETMFVPGEEAVGPWAPDMMHGRFLGGLAARQIEADHVDPGQRVARLTVDLFRAAPLEPVTVSSTVVRDGRRIRVVDTEVRVGEVHAAAVRAVILRCGDEPTGTIWQGPRWQSPPPETLPRFDPPEDAPRPPGEPAWDIRRHEGGFRTGERARVWTNETGQLVDGEPVSPLVRAALSADLASPLANGSDLGVAYINADYTLAMARYPMGTWVGLETQNHLASEGIALGECTLYDLDGPFATSVTTALANPMLS